MAVLLSKAAEDDLEGIWLASASEFGVTHAERVLEHLNSIFDLLDRFPDVGQNYPRIRKGVVYFPVRIYPFLVFYNRVRSDIRIVRILHDKMRVEDHL